MQHEHHPHMNEEGDYQFITFRTFDSTDEFLKKLLQQDKTNSQKQLEIDNYLDGSDTGSYLNDEVLVWMSDFLKTKDEVLYELIAFAIMPNHVHMLIKPFDKLETIMQKIKGSSAEKIDEMIQKDGSFWTEDYYAKAIKDEESFNITYNYIQKNPLKLGEDEDAFPRFYGTYGNITNQD